MLYDNHIKSSAQVADAHSWSNGSVSITHLKELFLGLQSLTNGLATKDILLRAADNTNVTKLKGVDLTLNDIKAVSSLVH